MKRLEPGVMEYWSIGIPREDIQPSDITPALQYSYTPKLMNICRPKRITFFGTWNRKDIRMAMMINA